VSPYPPEPFPSYHLAEVDQFAPWLVPDVVPADAAARTAHLRLLAADATVYGVPAVFQYAELYRQAVDRASDAYTGFNAFAHERQIATPTFMPFKTPNADTLYSNAWLDLTDGPVEVEIPSFGGRYYTLNFLDIYSNATNLSSRTVGRGGGRFLVATTTWDGEPQAGVRLFRVATPYAWILMRILLQPHHGDLQEAHRLQDAVALKPTAPPAQHRFVEASPDSVERDYETYFRALDFVLRTNGHPVQEDAYTYRFRTIGLGGLEPFDVATFAAPEREALAAGFADGMSVVKGSFGQAGVPLDGRGWVQGNPGAYGFNYLRRAVTNLMGLGGNVAAENQTFTTQRDELLQQLDGSVADYTWRCATPPPAEAAWSLTLYDRTTQQFNPNELGRYEIGGRTDGLAPDADGSLTIRIQHLRPRHAANWLPAPDGPFYLAIRAFQPKPELLDGAWLPEPIRRVATHERGER
jgi:hypothetical protein